ncbi:hypothetical protein HUT16_01885 [Kitasatospora sp. NA04385]|uniref:hypothetical protein n=1 Tax=Kitasatospora sp. NA04385 TaxID=2742135 RepID=UPI001591839B|nr:hypothetical protein [Kitasatospora sp. NA04385]QKW17974.1 hypothetical protein HUT16_01885 [Kitasatospora sp. NA04385]
MTRYGVDPDRHDLIAAWGTGEGDLVTRVAVLSPEAGTSALLGLARALTQLSDAAWRTYTHPGGSPGAPDSPGADSDERRRERERDRFGGVAEAITAPNLPHGGTIAVSYSRILESAHRVGRALLDLDDPALTGAVLSDVATELAAVENAELGDLTGRAQQAVMLSREDASPVQVAAADHLLDQDPFGPDPLFSTVDPTAAAVAAAHWLAAAAEVAATTSGRAPATVVIEADTIESLPYETPSLVLGLLHDGATPYEAVTGLVRHAMQITDGLLPDPAAVREQLEGLEEALTDYTGEDEPDLDDVALRLTPLDPRRPARDLLEDLLAGIHGCWLLHREYAEADERTGTGGAPGAPDDELAERQQRASRERFARLVRETAALRHDRLI